jgi:hypothetical protein
MLSSQLGVGSLGNFSLGRIGSLSGFVSRPITPDGRTFLSSCCGDHIAYISPEEIIDYALNWVGTSRQCLADDETIIASSWEASGIDVETYPSYIQPDGKTTTVWLTGGYIGSSYIVTNTIRTSGGRTLRKSFVVEVQDNL